MCPRRPPSRVLQGFTLVEVMIALTLLSIGMLGSARMQMFSTQATHAAYLRGQAVTLVQDFIDRMQANTTGAQSGNYDSADTVNYAVAADNGCSETHTTLASVCTPVQLAAHDRWEWSQNLAAALPNGQSSVCLDSNPADANACDGAGNIYTISISWSVSENGATVTKQYSARYEP